ncbi:hypothetical protein HYDPIDRAFT_85949 [Hydnomerulius pinastri MD-312]|nr:hypothetical protein HYDPIDRAFT_85949 [Hydnomerulius pinastri MD-312]
MAQTLLTVTQDIFKDRYPPIIIETSSEDAVSARLLQSLLDTAVHGAIGVAATYGEKCRISSIAFSTLSRALVVIFPESRIRRAKSKGKQEQILRARGLLQQYILCNPHLQKYAFVMDRISIALYLDLSLHINGAVDLLSLSTTSARRSLDGLMNSMGGELTLLKANVAKLFFNHRKSTEGMSDLALQAWAACRTATVVPSMSKRILALSRIDTEILPEKHLAILAKISRDGDRLDALKPTSVVNDVKEDFTVKQDKVNLVCSRFPTRIRTSRNQSIRIETQVGEKKSTVTAHAQSVQGRQAQLSVKGSFQGKKILSITTVGKEDPTHSESRREGLVLKALCKDVTLLSQPFFRSIWLPDENVSWPPPTLVHPRPLVYFPSRALNSSQDRAVEKILSHSDKDRVVVIQGPPGTGKTTVIAAAVTSAIQYANPSRTIWIAAQSNVAVKNIAEKLADVGFYDFKLLVSKDFHFDWHEHLYERLESCLIRSDTFGEAIVSASRLLLDARVILCTLSMLSHPKIGPFIRLVPVDTMIFDEASQIDAGDYLPMIHRFEKTLSKLVFIGDDKQLAPYGQEDIPELRSVFEFPHLQKRVLFLNTQYRMPTVIGDFISRHVYKSKLRTHHNIHDSKACRFIDVKKGREVKKGKSWANHEEALVVVHIARLYQATGKSFRIVTPYDGQRSVIENALKAAKLIWEDKVFNVDSFQGNEDEHIIISVVRSGGMGFLRNPRRTNVMLTRCKQSMVICSSQSFLSSQAANSLVGKLATALGPEAWMDGKDVVRGMLS